MGEALLIQMNELDLQLESDLRQLLNPIVAATPPARRRRRAGNSPVVVLRVVTPDRLGALPVEILS